MQIQISPTYDAMSLAVARFIVDFIQQHPQALLCFPSGDTPTGTFRHLVNLARTGQVDFSTCRFVGLDEWVGMNRNDTGSCGFYLQEQFFGPLQIPSANVTFFDGRSTDLDQECRRVDAFIRESGTIDLMMVGLGLNGHIGLNEPGVPFNLYSHYTALDSLTKQVAQKYFQRETTLQQGVTLGLQHLLEAKVAVLVASGAKKADIVARALQGEVTEQIPATVMQLHPNGYVYLDQEAASVLRPS